MQNGKKFCRKNKGAEQSYPVFFVFFLISVAVLFSFCWVGGCVTPPGGCGVFFFFLFWMGCVCVFFFFFFFFFVGFVGGLFFCVWFVVGIVCGFRSSILVDVPGFYEFMFLTPPSFHSLSQTLS